MKVNKIFSESGYKSPILSYPVAYLISFFWFILALIISPSGITAIDTISYINAYESISNAKPDIFRTPVYPVLLGIIKGVFGVNLMFKVVIIFQFIIFLLSSYVLKKLLLHYTGNNRVVFWICVIYLCLPSYVTATVCILTESLSISGIIFLLWFLTHSLPSFPSIKDIFYTFLCLFLLVYLRPIFIYLIPILFIFYTILICKNNKISIFRKCLPYLSLLLIFLSILAYKDKMKETYDIKSITFVSTINNYHTARERSGIIPSLTKNAELRECLNTAIEQSKDTYDDFKVFEGHIENNYGAFEEYVNELLIIYPRNTLATILYRFLYESTSHSAFGVAISYFPVYLLDNIIYPQMQFYWIIIILFIIVIIKEIKKSRSIPCESILLLLMSLGIVIASIIGAWAEWSRLMMPGAPALLLIIGKLCTLFQIKINNNQLL